MIDISPMMAYIESIKAFGECLKTIKPREHSHFLFSSNTGILIPDGFKAYFKWLEPLPGDVGDIEVMQ